MNSRIVQLAFLVTAGFFAGCDGDGVKRAFGKATPTPTPEPVVAPATPKPGSWMWEKNRRTLLDSTPKKR